MFLFGATSEHMSEVIQANQSGKQVLSVKEMCTTAKLNYLDLADLYILHYTYIHLTYTYTLNFNVSMTCNIKSLTMLMT